MRILYVCTFWGVRSCIAELLTNALALPDVEAFSAGFESGRIGRLPIEAMSKQGLELQHESPPTVFHYARKSEQFDVVVTLCNEASQENFQILYDMVDMLFAEKAEILHWNIRDFMNITDDTHEARLRSAENIVYEIKVAIDQCFGSPK